MNKVDFKNYLKKSSLNKKELSIVLNLPYGTVNNWGSTVPYPYWLEPFFKAYIKSIKFDIIIGMLKDFDLSE
ncbi:hypothetical protein A9K75_09585 [Campylobacter fetus subsp. testudinum]|uniref:hypothetical protein n=1 Tax=Campylobacter fetus TaxID=196 RepID=UPI0008188DE7|nr:hypothetical protein [Campylobacter fetus]OCR98862.1 hypothetical protein A9K75_09585 [Campylobacter fetus subsp. testudinum]